MTGEATEPAWNGYPLAVQTMGHSRGCYMHSHRVKADVSCVEVLVMTTAKVIESVMRPQFSEVVKKVFLVLKRRPRIDGGRAQETRERSRLH